MTAQLARPVLNVGIVTTNLEPMAAFYEGLFGFSRLPELVFPGSGTVHRFVAGDSILRLMVPEEVPSHDGASGDFLSATGYRYMTIVVTDVDAVCGEIGEHGGSLVLGPLELRPGVRIAQLRDPDGNWTEIVQEA
jgi:catechol 2,3-dioxygenase-like lactoylglutathione lyase family enzyme